ncbi:carboxymuconolactone decarboxylase family protein [Roseococcus sp. DSY-14]|uniref:carboxymuconolactone decarboxylase family protein n=1 Tax=Roseococcus sp. DSY-14 TaxID=3369650 RepID=UPI00387B3C0C
MTAFTLHDAETAPDASRPLLARTAAAWGFIPTLHATLAESPETLEAYGALFGLVGRSTLSPVEQQVAFQAANVLHGCEYCTMGHTVLSRRAGMDEAVLQALREGQVLPDARLQALRLFTEQVIRERGHAGDAAVEAFLAAGFTRANVLEVVLVVATKTISNYVNHLTHTPKEGFMADPSLAWTAPARRPAEPA